MLGWLKELVEPTSDYRIVKMCGGYVAQTYYAGSWWGIEEDGTTGMANSGIPSMPKPYVCDDEAEAGRRINLYHKINHEEEVIWQS